MEIKEIKDIVDNIHREWTELKTQNTKLINDQVEGRAVALQTELVEKMNAGLTDLEGQLKDVKAAMNRTALANAIGETSEQILTKARKEFRDFALKGGDRSFDIKALSSSADDGSTALMHPIQVAYERVLKDTDGMRLVAEVVMSGTNEYERVVSLSNAGAALAAETTANAATAAQEQKLITVKHYIWEARPRVSQVLLEDAYYDLETQLGMEIGEAITLAQNPYWITGTGTNQPLGVLGAAAGTDWGEVEQITTDVSGVVDYEDLVNFYYKLNKRYRNNGTWAMDSTTMAKIRLIVDGNGAYVWVPGFGDDPSTLMGKPVVEIPDMPDFAAGALAIAFGDFRKGYLISDRVGMSMQRDPYTAKPMVEFFTRVRSGGTIKDYNAFKILKIKA